MRARIIGCVLAAATLLIPTNAAADSPCLDDPTLCVGAGQPAACRSAGAIVSVTDPSQRAVSQSAATLADPNPRATTTAEVSVDVPAVPPLLPRVHVGALQSFCQAYLYGTGFTNHKACGRAGADEVYVDFNPMRIPVIVSARGLFHDACAATGIDGPGHNNTAIEQLLITVGDQLLPFELLGPVNSTVSPAEGVLIGFNEKWVSEIEGCNANQGAALRIEAGEVRVVIGWVSTSACL